MPSALTVRFRPAGLWRIGPDSGARMRTDRVFHSDSLFSAITIAMRDLGWVEEWIAVTAEARTPAVRMSSCFPFNAAGLLIQPPRTVWPPVQTGKVRWKAARFVPLSLVSSLLNDEELKEDQWAADPVSECLVPVTRHGPAPAPFRIVTRTTAAVDRVSGASEQADPIVALQFAQGAGLWFTAVFEDDAARETWEPRLRSAAILLSDTGIGGGRSRGWGRSRRPHFERGEWPAVLGGRSAEEGGETAWWLVSLFSPSEGDRVDWNRGNYSIVVRAGRVQSEAAWGDLKPASRLVAEGSVLLSGAPLAGTARNVATAELPHPVYRSGIALAVPVPWREAQRFSLMEPKSAAAVAEEEPAPVEELQEASSGIPLADARGSETAILSRDREEAVDHGEGIEGLVPEQIQEELSELAEPESGHLPEPEPGNVPEQEPSQAPSPEPAELPAPEPSKVPAPEPSTVPQPGPSDVPVPKPSEVPSPEPAELPVPEPAPVAPSEVPAPEPSEVPAPEPSEVRQPAPSEVPAPAPSEVPVPPPSELPGELPRESAEADTPTTPIGDPPPPEQPPVQDPPAQPDEEEPRA